MLEREHKHPLPPGQNQINCKTAGLSSFIIIPLYVPPWTQYNSPEKRFLSSIFGVHLFATTSIQ